MVGWGCVEHSGAATSRGWGGCGSAGGEIGFVSWKDREQIDYKGKENECFIRAEICVCFLRHCIPTSERVLRNNMHSIYIVVYTDSCMRACSHAW